MKLFLSLLMLAAVPAALAQNRESQVTVVPPVQSSVPLSAEQQKLKAKAEELIRREIDRMSQTGCPLFLESAKVAPNATYLPAGSHPLDGAFDLRFRNQSDKTITSASITARILGKRSVYQLDASEFDLQMTFTGVNAVDMAAEQLRTIRLPEKMYLYGVAQVTLIG